MLISLFGLIGLWFLFNMHASAVPANSVEQTFSQPVGTTFQARPFGDEFVSYCVAEDGYVIVKGTNDYWYYASVSACEEQGVKADKIVPSGFKYKLDPVPPAAL